MKKVTEMYFVSHTGVFPRELAVSVRYSVVESVSHGALCAYSTTVGNEGREGDDGQVSSALLRNF